MVVVVVWGVGEGEDKRCVSPSVTEREKGGGRKADCQAGRHASPPSPPKKKKKKPCQYPLSPPTPHPTHPAHTSRKRKTLPAGRTYVHTGTYIVREEDLGLVHEHELVGRLGVVSVLVFILGDGGGGFVSAGLG